MQLARSVAHAFLEKKGENVVILNIGELSSFADYFVIATAQSDRQVRAMASSLAESLKLQGIRPLGIEGEMLSQWVLVDYGAVVAHVLREDARMFYDLEGLWREAPRVAAVEDLAAGAG